MIKYVSTKLIFKGVVQGVGFRPTVYRVAKRLGSHGFVLNTGSEVEVVIDTDPEEFIKELKKFLPSLAHISSVKKRSDNRSYSDFTIKKSKQGSKQSLIPVDTALCKDCLAELFDKSDRRHCYPFTNCTVCGARYSVIKAVPYDRKETAMEKFPLCKECTEEYTDPLNRRYHAQTISCPTCGPRYELYDENGNNLKEEYPIIAFARKIDAGKIGVIKSWGGMHLCCIIDEISSFRSWYHRPQKSFAVMVKDLETARGLAEISDEQEEILLSSQRPIVLMKKKKELNIAPGLDYIGLFLPYTPVHHLLFDSLKHNSLVMTSANIPGEPMITENNEAFQLGADVYLLHNRAIPNRVDDTVMKLWKKNRFFIRKSRGFVPDPISVPYASQIISVGPGENVTGSISTHKNLYLTPYIGKTSSYEALSFLEESLEHLMNLFMEKKQIDAIAMDLHPGYETKALAKRFAEKYQAPLFSFQHHWAHAASLLLDTNQSEAVVLSLDGLGYGKDESLWGSEVIYASFTDYSRISHFEPVPLIGGDKAALDPRRVLFAIFDQFDEQHYFSEMEAEIFRKMIPSSPKSTSFGRVLDAVSCYLGICCNRTYDGEPAMKLERYLSSGSKRFLFHPVIRRDVVQTVDLFQQLHDEAKRFSHPLTEKNRADLAFSFVHSLVSSLTTEAIHHAQTNKIPFIGITGGVSYNIPIVEMIYKQIKKENLHVLIHHRIPNGDGGISAGQNVLAGHKV
jgi:hydrogenase maturation protein HypF